MTKLTVLLTVYNGEAFLAETIKSILDQTYKDFKFLILDNASTDSSREVVKSFDDPRIQLIALPENIGQVAALNKGMDAIDTPLTARIDADDVCLPRRFQRQVEYMDSHPETGVCGTYAVAFEGNKESRWQWPCDSEEIKVQLLFECCIGHPTVVMRTDMFNKYELRYDDTLGHSEDWDLWQRASKHFKTANIPEYLLRYRLHEKNESKRILHRQYETAQKLDSRSLGYLGLQDHPLRTVHRDVAFTTFKAKNRGPDFLSRAAEWFEVLEIANYRHKVYDLHVLHRFLEERLFIVLHYNTAYRRTVLDVFFKKKLYRRAGFFKSGKFVLKVFLSIFGFKTK